MASDQSLKDLFEKTNNIAVIGIKEGENEDAYRVPRYMQKAGYRIRPVNPKLDHVLGEDCVASIGEIEGLEEGVDVIGVSCHSWEYLYYLDEMFELLKSRELDIPVVVGGSVLSQDDKAEIQAKGVAATFGPGSDAGEIVQQIRSLARTRGAA